MTETQLTGKRWEADQILGDPLSDPVMTSLIARYGDLHLTRRPPFVVLTRSIIAQQISTKAANTIRRRLSGQIGLAARVIAGTSLLVLRSVGLSRSKALCVRHAARWAIKGKLQELRRLTDDEVKSRLRQIKGVGPWTAEMFLIFALSRPDIWPVTDAGLKAAARKLYGVTSYTALVELGSRFRPMRSVATRYLWRALENV